MNAHKLAVATISSDVTRFHNRKQPFRIYHGCTNSTRKVTFDRDKLIDTSGLSSVLCIDKARKVAMVEPNVPMGKLATTILAHGLLPPVVTEFPGITVGGAFSGTAGESASFKFGFFDSTVNWIEIVLANGKVVIASPTQCSDLFYGAAGSLGTLGVLTALEIQLIDAKPFAKLTYLPVKGIEDAMQQIRATTEDPSNDYIDAIMFSKNSGVVLAGRLIDDASKCETIQRFTGPQDPWFYLHAEQLLAKEADRHSAEKPFMSKISPYSEVIPIIDYLFRYDRGAFWAAKPVFTYFNVPFNNFTRRLTDPFMHTKTLYHGLHENGMAKDNIIQDLALPASRAQGFMEWLDAEYNIYPLWLCPIRQSEHKTFNPVTQPNTALVENEKHSARHFCTSPSHGIPNQATIPPELLLSIGVWGPRLPDPSAFVAENRKVERKVRSLGGFKWLYAHCHYTEAEFWDIYDEKWYTALRAKYHATYLPTVFEKVKYDWGAEERAIKGSWLRWLFSWLWWIWPMPGIYGVLCVLLQSEYLLTK